MSNETIFIHDSGDGTVSMHAVKRKEIDRHISNYTIRYWENDHNWTPHTRGKKSMKLVDTGNGVVLKVKGKQGDEISLDYSQIHDVAMLIEEYNKNSSFKTTYKRMKLPK